MNLGAPGSSKGRLQDAYIGEKNRGGSLMIDARFWEQELLDCTVHPDKKRGGIVLVARSAAQVKGELKGR